MRIFCLFSLCFYLFRKYIKGLKYLIRLLDHPTDCIYYGIVNPLFECFCFRPLSEEDQRSNVPMVVTCNEHRREVSISQNVANRQVDKVFTFDKVRCLSFDTYMVP